VTRVLFLGSDLADRKTFRATATILSEYQDGREASLQCILTVVVVRVPTVFWETVSIPQNTLKNTAGDNKLLLDQYPSAVYCKMNS